MLPERLQQEQNAPAEPLPPVGVRIRAFLAVILLTVATAMVARALAAPLYKSPAPEGTATEDEVSAPAGLVVDRLKLLPSPLPRPAGQSEFAVDRSGNPSLRREHGEDAGRKDHGVAPERPATAPRGLREGR